MLAKSAAVTSSVMSDQKGVFYCRGVLLWDASVSKGIEEAIARAEPQDIYAFRIPQGAFLRRTTDLEASRCNLFFLFFVIMIQTEKTYKVHIIVAQSR